MFPQHCLQLDAVAEVYSKAATWEDVNDLVSLRCGDHLIRWAGETLGHRALENMERQIGLRNCHHSDDEDDDDNNGSSTDYGQDKGDTTIEGKVPVRPDQHGGDDNNPSGEDDTRAL